MTDPREPSEWAREKAQIIITGLPLYMMIDNKVDADVVESVIATAALALDAARAEAEEALLKRLDDERWEEREPGVTAEWVEEHTAAATDGGSLVAVWREWLSAYGPGIFTRLSMARDIDGLLARARAEGRREGIEEAAKVAVMALEELSRLRALKVTP